MAVRIKIIDGTHPERDKVLCAIYDFLVSKDLKPSFLDRIDMTIDVPFPPRRILAALAKETPK